MLDQEKNQLQKQFGSKKNLAQKFLGMKKFWIKKKF